MTGNMIAAAFFGALIGGGLGLGACILFFDDPLLFPGDTILAGAITCGILGLVFGEGFVEFLKEHWWRF